MAYVYLDDNGPESEDYDSNYYFFDESNTEIVARIESLLTSAAPRDEAFRERISELCQASLRKPERKKASFRAKAGVSKVFIKYISMFNPMLKPHFARG